MVVAQLRNTQAIINLSHLKFNALQIKKHIPDRLLYAVVKADAYGHGAVQIATYLQQEKLVDGFCVAMLDEALALRQNQITLPILVLGLTSCEYVQYAIDNDIILTADSVVFVKNALAHITKGTLNLHIAVNTGMNRIGLMSQDELSELMSLVEQDEHVHVSGIFTHFATADGEDDNKVKQQYIRFQKIIQPFTQKIEHIHLANSAMNLWHFNCESDIARIGIGLYGVNPSDFTLSLPFVLKPVLSLQTEIIHTHYLKRGESVSYGAKYIAKCDEWIGVLPIGYADGWHRDLSGKCVYVNDEPCEILGVVCMDQMMIRLPDNMPIGTPVELIGENNSVESIATSIGTIGYEILCHIGPRVKRVYQE